MCTCDPGWYGEHCDRTCGSEVGLFCVHGSCRRRKTKTTKTKEVEETSFPDSSTSSICVTV